MPRTKKANQAKNAGENTKDAAKEAEKVEQTQEATQEPETAEEAQEVTQEPEAAGQAQEASQETGHTNAKTSAEDAAAIEAAASGVKMEMSESGEITIEPEPDMFANLPNPCVYCGPSVKGVARQYTTYQGGIPDALRKFIQEHPGALGLIVSTGGFPAMRRRLEKHGTTEAELYKAVKAEL
ncbi:MAG: hypothetical protein HDT35_01010 [Clostridiales bacterium]|nr:hypothetical protein [Clostridiales bacterium]